MAYQDDFRNKVLQALKAKNLAVDISQEATQQAIVEEAQNVANQEARPMSPEEMKQVLQDVANQLAAEQQQFEAQSYDFTAYGQPQLAGAPGNYPGGGFAISTASKDIMMIPTAGTAGTVNTLSQIDFKFIYNPSTYGVLDATEVKSSIYNWAERLSGQTFDTPVLGIGGAWGGISYTPNSGYGVGTATAGLGASIFTNTGRGNIIFLKPAISTINAALFNDVGLDSTAASYYFTITGYNSALPNANPVAGFAVSFGGIGGSGPIGISGALSGLQYNQIKFLSPFTVTNTTVTDTLTLGISSAIATTQFFVGGTGQVQNNYVLSTAASSYTLGDIFYAGGTGHTNLAKLSVVGNNYYLTTTNGVPAWTNSIAANTVAVNAAIGSTILYPLLNNISGSGSAISTDVDFSVDPGLNILRYASGSFYVGSAVSSPTYTGAGALVTYTSPASVIIKPGVNATNAVLVQAAAGATVLNVDTTFGRLSVGNGVTAPVYTLDVLGDTNLNTGSVYRIAGTSVLSNNTLGSSVVTSSLTALGIVTTGTWSASAVTAFYGGTGLQTYVIGDLLYASTSSTLAKLAAVATGSFLVSNGVGVAPQYVAGSGVSVGLVTISANTGNADNYITFVNNIGGIGLSISNQTSQLTYNPASQVLKIPYISGTAFTASFLTGTINTATQPNITSAANLSTVGAISTGQWNSTAIGTTYGGTGSNLGPGGSIGNSNRIIVTGNTNNYASSLIDNATSGYLLVSGGALAAPTFTNTTSANLSLGGLVTFSNSAPQTPVVPTNANDLVNKTYVDSISGGLDPHASVRLTTIAAIGGSYRQGSGVAGTTWGAGDVIIAATTAELIGSMSGLDTPTSGIALTVGQRVLIKDGVTGGYAALNGAFGAFPSTFGGFAASYVANGIYTVASWGGAATTGWLLIRATDTDNATGVQELTGGTFTFVEEGTTYADNAFVCTNDTTSFGPIGFGSTQITWSPFSGGASLTMGQGLSKSGNTIATNFNLAASTGINANLSRGFSIGGARSGSVGSSSYDTFTVTGTNATLGSATLTVDNVGYTLAGGETAGTSVQLLMRGVADANTITGLADGWTHSGGTSARTLTVAGGNILLNGAGFGLTLGSQSILSTNGNTLSVGLGAANITLQSGAAFGTTLATAHNLVQNGSAQYQLSTSIATFGSGDLYYGAGSAFTALSRLALGSGVGASVLVRDGSIAPKWGTIALGDSNFVSGILTTSNGGTNSTAAPTSGGIAYGASGAYAFTNAGTAGQALLSGGTGAPTFGTLSLAGGGTSNTISGAGISYQLAQYTASGLAISSVALPTAANSVLIAATPISVAWSNGPLGVIYGGTNATTSNFTSNGAVIYDSANTRLISATGTTITSGVGISVIGTIASTGGFFIGGSSVVTSLNISGGSGGNGAVTLASSSSSGGTVYLTQSTNTITLNYPGTGITGTGSANQVAYYNASRELTGNVGLVYSPIAATGVGLSVNVNAASGTIFSVNTAQALTAGNLLDIDNNGTQRFGVDFKGMATHTAGSGNTALIVSNGRTVLSAPNASYATLNLGNTNANPGTGNSYIGDLWFNGTNLFFQTGTTSKFDLLVGSVSGSGTVNKVVKWNTTTSLTDSNMSDAGLGLTITSSGSIGPGTGSSALLTLQTLSGDNQLTDRYFVRGVTSAGARLFSIDTAGNLRATTKSFDIPHPTKEGLRLVYGVLEGPEHGVYHRGTVEGKGIIQINLPDYWHKLVGDQYTIQLTPWGNYNVGIGSKTENYFTIQLVGDIISRKYKNIKVDYIVHGSRLDAPLDIEQ